MINLHPDGLAIGSLLVAHAACIGIALIKRNNISELDEASSMALKEKYDCKQIPDIYRPQRSCGKVMFLHLSAILFT